ncbi:MAG: hypothetical protein COW03_14500 [Cytophagales bacterium CG12_big_fil_rev_8_21_14_0_65_40_12]|nr:MAG: hypothetical protein COW03_14500 [Cytophagales bacterium CG12_big_fil_rev_8_21_14_0_65_40_12]PIW04138.1 MAG: hypothetical protein COW40_11685 [Cytophagales bacterium CG17_big_fil_post_rev_8_21_14_2_50_40_13]
MHKFAYLILNLLIGSYLFVSPSSSLQELTSKLEKYSSEFPQEKIYLHTDKAHYLPGETIWLKSYLVAGALHQPSPISNNVHIELIDTNNKLITSALLRSENGLSDGIVILPMELAPGKYLLRGFTNWMRNFGDDFFFQKEITVLSYDDTQKQTAPKSSSVDLQFFPEGGHLVDKVATRVAFKAIDSNGEGVEINTNVFDDQGKMIAELTTQHDGMGFFSLIPELGKNYTAEINNKKFELPKIEAQGFSISVNNAMEDIMRLTFRSNEKTTEKDKMNVIIHSRGLISYAYPIDLSQNIAFQNIPKNIMPEGIQHITLFDAKGNPVVERLVFVKKDGVVVAVETDKENYGTREKVTAQLKVVDSKGNPVQSSLSMAALDINQTIEDKPSTTIASNLLLTSDLKGYIKNPTHYFDPNNQEADQQLDLVMMTHGWVRFNWESILKEEYPQVDHLIEKGINIKGTLVDQFNDKPIENGEVTYFDNSFNPPVIENVKTDKDGRWEIFNVIAYNTKPISFQGATKKGKKFVSFKFDSLNNYVAPVDWIKSPLPIELNQEELNFVEKSKERLQIDEAYDFDTSLTVLESVTVEGKRYTEDQKQSAYGSGDNTFSFDKISETSRLARNPLEILQGRIAGVQIAGSGPFMTIQIRGASTGLGAAAAPAIFLNDIPTDLQTVLYIPAMDIERVEIFKGPSAAVFGSIGGAGVIAFYTYQGVKVSSKPSEGIYATILKNAYQGNREFYAPKYDKFEPEHIKPDKRVLVYWAPKIMTNEKGEATVEFWTTDLETDIALDFQGITQTGQTLTDYKTVTVKKNK